MNDVQEMNEHCISRFFLKSDTAKHEFLFKIPEVWWSRAYEYGWAGQFAEVDDVALDAACGLEHPLKFFLLDHCREIHACDRDEDILDTEQIKEAMVQAYGRETVEDFPQYYLHKVNFSCSDLATLPYASDYFDKIYCISVLEHLRDLFNKFFWLSPLKPLLRFRSRLIELALTEFKRVLKDDGHIVLTFDYPRINLRYFAYLVDNLGFQFSGPVDFTLPDEALYSPSHKLFCFRAVLRKKFL